MSRCAMTPESGAACAISTKPAWIGASSSLSVRRCDSVPEEVERDLVYIELRLPDFTELVNFLRRRRGANLGARRQRRHQRCHCASACPRAAGLTLNEARHAVRRAMVTTGHLGADSMAALLEEKRLLVNRTGFVEFIASGADVAQIGGLDILKEWLKERKKLFQLRDSVTTDIDPRACSSWDSGVRQKSLGQGDCFALRPAALPHRHG